MGLGSEGFKDIGFRAHGKFHALYIVSTRVSCEFELLQLVWEFQGYHAHCEFSWW